MTRRQKRLTLGAVVGALVVAASALVLTALNQSLTFFYSPSDLATLEAAPERPIRLGGLVVEDSVRRGDDDLLEFDVTDLQNSISVRFNGSPPDLFREGQGVVVQGIVANGVLMADEILAKHDENYMPREVADALKESGRWKDGAE